MRSIACLLLPAALFAADAPKKEAPDQDRIQGAWACESAEQGGMAVPAERAKGFKMAFKGDKFTLTMPGRQHEATFKLAPGEKPKQLTLTPSDGAGELKGIYALDGDTLKICSAAAGKPRPTTFESRKGDFGGLMILKRVAPAAGTRPGGK